MNNSRLNPEIIKYREIDSTNNEAVRLLTKKKSFPYWIVAEKQTDGKGRKNEKKGAAKKITRNLTTTSTQTHETMYKMKAKAQTLTI